MNKNALEVLLDALTFKDKLKGSLLAIGVNVIFYFAVTSDQTILELVAQALIFFSVLKICALAIQGKPDNVKEAPNLSAAQFQKASESIHWGANAAVSWQVEVITMKSVNKVIMVFVGIQFTLVMDLLAHYNYMVFFWISTDLAWVAQYVANKNAELLNDQLGKQNEQTEKVQKLIESLWYLIPKGDTAQNPFTNKYIFEENEAKLK